MPLLSPALQTTFKHDKQRLETTHVPIVTVSASYKEDLKELYNLPFQPYIPDVVFSRAHYSMALAIATQAWGERMQPSKAWVVDPTNYVAQDEWGKIKLTESVGHTIARFPILQTIKGAIDSLGRQKLPILKSITPPLLHLTQDIHRPILSLHIAAGNILAAQGKPVLQVVTDPHIRDEYVAFADKPWVRFAVFDDKTKFELLEKAALLNKKMIQKNVVVTGPPIDPRIVAARRRKVAWRRGPLRLVITTGGIGTNFTQIRRCLYQLLPELRKRPHSFQVIVYAATHLHLAKIVSDLANEESVSLTKLTATTSRSELAHLKLGLIYHPQLVDANEILTKHAFKWADGFITKPSGDMAYDAAAAGCFVLTLDEWGSWEENVRQTFEQLGVSRVAQPEKLIQQLEALSSSKGKSQSWVESAMNSAFNLPPLYRQGAKNILEAYEEWQIASS